MKLRYGFASITCALLLTIGCGEDPPADVDSGRPLVDSGPAAFDSGPAESDAGPPDAGPPAPDAFVATADAMVGAFCSYNGDCAADQRCSCTDEDGCGCVVGPRGTGLNGIDECTDEDECKDGLCIEGPPQTMAFYCSNICETDDDCTGMLPRCLDVAFLGRVCVREDPNG